MAPARAPSAPGQPPGGPPPWAGLPNGRVRSPEWLAPSGAGSGVCKPEGSKPLGPAGRVCSPEGFAPSSPTGFSGHSAQAEEALRLSRGATAHAAGLHSNDGSNSAAGGSSNGSIMAGGGGTAVGMMQAGRRAGLGASLAQPGDLGLSGSGIFGGHTAPVRSSKACELGCKSDLQVHYT